MEKIRIFVDRYGLFIMLFACTLVIVGSGLWAYSLREPKEETGVQAGGMADFVQNLEEAARIRLYAPVRGEPQRAYAESIYLETLQLFGPHEAIDFAGETKDPVYAAQDGVVSSVVRDGALGCVVVLSHGEGIETRYAGLRWPPIVKEAESVSAGQAIGSVGTIPIEAADPPHVHFALYIDGKAANPADYF